MPKRLHASGRGSSRVPRNAVEIYGRIEEIKAQKSHKSNWPNTYFKHKFTRKGGKIYGLPNGQLLVVGNHPLWDMHEYPDNYDTRGGRMARRRRRRGFSFMNLALKNVWRGHSAGHRRAARARWRKHHAVKSHRRKHRRVGRPRKRKATAVRVKHRRHRRHYRKHRGYIDKRTKVYRRRRRAEYKEAAGYLAMTAPGGRYTYKSGVGYVKRRRHHRRGNPMRYGNRRRHRHHRRHRRNPENIASLGGYNWTKGIEPALVIGTSIMASQVAVGYLGSRGYMTFDSAWKRYGVQIGAGVAGVFALRAMKKNDWAQYWGLGALVTVTADLLATYVLPSINSMLAPAPAAATTTATGTAGFRGGMGAFPRDIRGVGAFPSQVQRVSSPYDRSGSYPY